MALTLICIELTLKDNNNKCTIEYRVASAAIARDGTLKSFNTKQARPVTVLTMAMAAGTCTLRICLGTHDQ